MIYRGPGILAVVLSNSLPTPFPFSHEQVVYLSQSFCVSPVELTDGRGGGGGRRAKSFDREKARPSIIHSILSGYKKLQALLLNSVAVSVTKMTIRLFRFGCSTIDSSQMRSVFGLEDDASSSACPAGLTTRQVLLRCAKRLTCPGKSYVHCTCGVRNNFSSS
jgi:hypothetical protein